jgi:hypothetical protein
MNLSLRADTQKVACKVSLCRRVIAALLNCILIFCVYGQPDISINMVVSGHKTGHTGSQYVTSLLRSAPGCRKNI